MALTQPDLDPRDPRVVNILAKSIYRDLRGAGLAEHDVMALAGALLELVTREVQERRGPAGGGG